jgi:hypothetical protein
MAAQGPSPLGLGGAFDRIVKGLQQHPPLLYGLGGGILLIALVGAVGGIAADQLWLFVVALIVLVLAGLGAWLVIARKPAAPGRPVARAGGDVTTEGDGKVLEVEGSPEGWAPLIEAGGHIKAKDRGEIGVLKRRDPPEPRQGPES